MYTKCLKFRLFPTKSQETLLEQNLGLCREVYNSFLLWRIARWETEHKSVGYHEQANALPAWKKAHPELTQVFSQVLQNVAVRVDLAFKAFFARVKRGDTPGFPRFKRDSYDSITYPQDGFKVHEQSVYVSKIGMVKAILHRTVEGKMLCAKPRKMEQTIKTCTVRRQNDKWFVCFVIAYEDKPLSESTENIGIDVGIKTFAALSNGEFIANPKFLRTDEMALAKAQRKVEKHKKGSPAQRKARKVVRRIHERIRNRRHNFLHQESRKIVNTYGLIAVEKLHIKNMSKSPAPKPDPENAGQFLPNGHAAKAGLNKRILDAGWGLFRTILMNKAASAGRKVAEVNPAWTSQDCSGCGTRVKKKLRERVHFCPHCGLSLDRDTNAALNILRIGVGQHTVPG